MVNIRDDIKYLRSMGFNVFSGLRAAYELLRTIQNPAKSDVRYGVRRLVKSAASSSNDTTVKYLTSVPGLQDLFAEKYDPEVDVNFLEKLPEGTLGREYARFLRDNSIDPLQDYLSDESRTNLFSYAIYRSYKLHDIMHVVFDCDTSILGEIKIVSLSYAQGHGQAPALALGVLFLHLAMVNPGQFAEAIKKSVEWYELGKTCPTHYTFKFEEHWHRPISEVREALMAS